MTPDFYRDLQSRGLVHQSTGVELPDLLASQSLTAYVGFDPTAASLHVGSLLPVLGLVRLQRAGHSPIALVGGGTGLIGDPSGKAVERAMLTREQLAANAAGMRAQLERFLDFSGKHAARLLDNAEWLCRLSLLDFLRDIGKHFTVNQMVARDSVQLRLTNREQGISFTEFSYALLQAYDFLELYDRHGCRLQLGGSDQWGNIVDGCDLIRRLRSGAAYGLTMPLVTKADGSKFGKSESGNVWLDPSLTRPFQFYQFWLNTDDKDAGRYLRFFTFLADERLAELDAQQAANPAARVAQKALAAAVTELVHGEPALRSAQRATAILFEGGDLRQLGVEEVVDFAASAPRTTLARSALGTAEAALASELARGALSPSRGQARQAIQSGSIFVNNQPVQDPLRVLGLEDVVAERFIVLRRGKKTYHVIEVI